MTQGEREERTRKLLMMYEFLFCPLERIKEKILEFKQTKDPALFAMLLLRFDLFAVYVCHKFKRKYIFLANVPLEDLYHTAIIAVYKSFVSMPDDWKVDLILQRVKSYIKCEFTTLFKDKVAMRSYSLERYDSNHQETISAQVLRNKIDCYVILNSLAEDDRILIVKKVMDGWTYEELRQEYGGISKQSLSKRVQKILKKIRRVADK